MRDALIGLASAFVIPFVFITVVVPFAFPMAGRWLQLSPLGMFVAFAIFLGVAVYAVGKTAHAFFEFDWSEILNTRRQTSVELSKTSQTIN